MVLSLRKIKRVSLFICLFFFCVYLLSQLFQLFVTFFPIRAPYQEPYGNAVKVSTIQNIEQTSSDPATWIDRLFVFYWIGE